ncbi:MAG TPA: glycosyltransferase [Solirubrobacteraceae bacterium]|nr:glycosyltransferase [Solirubrobacteraceae bacterium]
MIAFGVAITDESTYRRLAAPGLERAVEPGSLVMARRGRPSIQAAYNEMLDVAARLPGLEALVLLHQDLEIRGDHFAERVRHVLADDRVAIVGAIGARGVRTIAWWEGTESVGQIAAPLLLREPQALGTPVQSPETVDAVDGSLLALSPWAVRHLRLDPGYAPLHGYDVDLCFEARRRGRLVAVTNLDLGHHSTHGIRDRNGWVRGYLRFARKWRVPDSPPPARRSP